MRNLAQAQADLAVELQRKGMKVAPDAMEPMGKIDFGKLVSIHDHEEHFLRETFIHTLVALRRARPTSNLDQGRITADDVETALRMLGVAVGRQSEATLSSASKGVIKDACGFC